jgi:D-alanyl-D-alanine carboxypeptidase
MALYAMIQEMSADGAWDIVVTSGYRSYSYQSSLYHGTYYNREKAKNPGLSDEEIYKIIDTYSARPGTSDHQTGLCVDLIEPSKYDLDETFENSKAFKWLEKNAYRFGFILRFPEGKTDITGYTYEPWHWRFVGQLSAYKIHSAGLTLEEFLASEQ